jgi:hypothetical protein
MSRNDFLVLSKRRTGISHETLNILISRLLIYYPFSSIIALFANIISNPAQPSVKRDFELITEGRKFFETLTGTFEVADKLIELTEGFERTACRVIGQEDCHKRTRDTTPPVYSEEEQPTYAAMAAGDWLTNDFLDSTHSMNGSDFQAQLLQSSDMWMAPASLDWGNWLEYIGRMPIDR